MINDGTAVDNTLMKRIQAVEEGIAKGFWESTLLNAIINGSCHVEVLGAEELAERKVNVVSEDEITVYHLVALLKSTVTALLILMGHVTTLTEML